MAEAQEPEAAGGVDLSKEDAATLSTEQEQGQEEATPKKKPAQAYDRLLDPKGGHAVINEGEVGQQFIGDHMRLGSYTNAGKYQTINATNVTEHNEKTNIYNFYYGPNARNAPEDEQWAPDGRDTERQPGEHTGDLAHARELLEKPGELSQWFYHLGNFERCIVQAMAVFDGSTVKEVMNAARWLAVGRVSSEQDTSDGKSAGFVQSRDMDNPEEILKRTFVRRFRRGRSMRCQWIDTDAQGNSVFKTRVLSLLAEHVQFWQNNTFYDQLYIWADNLIDENMHAALQALGTIAWHNKQDLEQIAQRWATSRLDWFRASSFLLGAFEQDRQEFGHERALHPHKSPIFSILQKWSRQALIPRYQYPACAAVLTYALFGTEWPQVAFDGLESLLKNPDQYIAQYESGEREFSGVLYETIVMAYPYLADVGHLRLVLEYLAGQARLLVYQRTRPNTAGMSRNEREKVRHEQWLRQLRTDMVLDAFYHLARESLRRQKTARWVYYDLSIALPESPSLDESAGRDIFLAGLLSSSETAWQEQLCTLLCSLFISNARDAAFYLLRAWLELVLKDQGPTPDQVRLRYLQFVLRVASTGQRWSDDLQNLSIKAPDVHRLFVRKLEQWHAEGVRKNLPLALFAQDALDAFAFPENVRQ